MFQTKRQEENEGRKDSDSDFKHPSNFEGETRNTEAAEGNAWENAMFKSTLHITHSLFLSCPVSTLCSSSLTIFSCPFLFLLFLPSLLITHKSHVMLEWKHSPFVCTELDSILFLLCCLHSIPASFPCLALNFQEQQRGQEKGDEATIPATWHDIKRECIWGRGRERSRHQKSQGKVDEERGNRHFSCFALEVFSFSFHYSPRKASLEGGRERKILHTNWR